MTILRKDPSRTTMLRRQFIGDFNRRYRALRKLNKQLIVEDDVFGLKDPDTLSLNNTELVNNQLPGRQAWAFQTDAQKLNSYRDWLQEQINEGLLSVDGVGDPWTSTHIDSAYRKGVVRAYNDVNRETGEESLDFMRGRRDQFLESSFAHGERASKLQFLYTRTYEQLRGINAAMSQQLQFYLAQGLSQGLSPITIARQIDENISDINRIRARRLARTEIIAAHAEGQLDAFGELGVTHVGLMAEWSTAGDDLVCPLCEPLEGAIMTIREARGILPRHPNCRCAWIPANVGERSKKESARDRAATKGKVDDSLKAGLPKTTRAGDKVPQTIREAKRRSLWEGKNKSF